MAKELETEVTFGVFAIYECPNCCKHNKQKIYRAVLEKDLRAFQCNCGETIWVKGGN